MDLYMYFNDLFDQIGLGNSEWGIVLNDFVSVILTLIIVLLPVLIVFSIIWRMIKRW